MVSTRAYSDSVEFVDYNPQGHTGKCHWHLKVVFCPKSDADLMHNIYGSRADFKTHTLPAPSFEFDGVPACSLQYFNRILFVYSNDSGDLSCKRTDPVPFLLKETNCSLSTTLQKMV